MQQPITLEHTRETIRRVATAKNIVIFGVGQLVKYYGGVPSYLLYQLVVHSPKLADKLVEHLAKLPEESLPQQEQEASAILTPEPGRDTF